MPYTCPELPPAAGGSFTLPGAEMPVDLPEFAVEDLGSWQLPTPGRVLIAGDTHGNTTHWNNLVHHAKRNSCDGIVCVGDWGYWPHTPDGQRFLRSVHTMLAGAGLWLVWVDGNHENHTALRARYPWHDAPNAAGVTPMTSTIFYAHRGARWTWADRRWGALGGAFSVDVEARVMGVSWWPEEEITQREAAKLCAAVPRLGHVDYVDGEPLEDATVDVLVTHDCPSGAKITGLSRLSPPIAMRADGHRLLLQQVVDAVRPQLLVCGHFHLRRSIRTELPDGSIAQVEIIDADAHPRSISWEILDLTTRPYTAPRALVADMTAVVSLPVNWFTTPAGPPRGVDRSKALDPELLAAVQAALVAELDTQLCVDDVHIAQVAANLVGGLVAQTVRRQARDRRRRSGQKVAQMVHELAAANAEIDRLRAQLAELRPLPDTTDVESK